MDETKIALPAWLPWATTACLAALVACLGELWIIERTRSQMLRDENLMAAATLKAAQNQEEAERIITRREIEKLGAVSTANSVALLPPGGASADPADSGRPWGAAVWDGTGQGIHILFAGLPVLGAERDYQLWVVGQGVSQGNLGTVLKDSSIPVSLHLAVSAQPNLRIILIAGEKGGAATLEEARAKGSIVLATPPPPGKISN